MIPVSILLFIILRIKQTSVLSYLRPITNWLHTSCLQQIPASSEWQDIYGAFVCGEYLPEGQIKKVFVATGVIHLMIISGAHLVFIEKTWSALPSFRFKQLSLAIFLMLYALTAGLKPPILRALFSLSIHRINKKLKLFYSPYWKVQFSGMLCLICHSAWAHSISLQLSLLASLGMANHSMSRIKSCALTYLIILPIISAWGGLHPLSILINWVLTPIASVILLPLSMLVVPLPWIHLLVDLLWSYFLQILNWIRPVMENQGLQIISFSSFYIWIYIWVLFILLQIIYIYIQQTK